MEYIDLLNYKNANSEESLDRYTSLILEAHFDQQLKEEWIGKLQNNHGVLKSGESKKTKLVRLRKYFWWTSGVAAILALFWLNLPMSDQFTLTTDQFVLAELSQPLPYYGRRKGMGDENKIREQAYDNYQEKNFTSAILSFGELERRGKLVNDDILFYALTYLYKEEYSKAIFHLAEMSNREQFSSHTHWYLSLAYYQDGQNELAKKALIKHLSLDTKGIKQKEAHHLLKKLQEGS